MAVRLTKLRRSVKPGLRVAFANAEHGAWIELRVDSAVLLLQDGPN
jgi:hypothetical protein